eukprot:TRINITY_DN5644_c0_g1_i1.p1 TRINITY_DN5644_c0_g1~~TRINITY_DN5644_c0_g1_i1.p1  ORF type:complete len:2035 (-),score=923.82 TRINITY_DN5644_c0_g1_i1:31-6135(-)
MEATNSVQVAVRVRPFNSREIERGSQNVIRMKGKKTTIIDPELPEGSNEKHFTFDFSYSSFDTKDPEYATQEQVMKDLGVSVLDNAWQGYNCSIFAYGQTGSGKSYSMLGYGEDKGLIPRICEAMFEKINENRDPNVIFKVEVSFMEIYNETVKDLLNPKNKGKLKVRNHPKIGPYVEDLSKLAVKSFAEIDNLMDEGTKARTVASTNMNATSSRSHAVFTIDFTTAKLTGDASTSSETLSRINLVDLAGSERAASTGNTGVRLKEGANINKSLSSLGKVISALAANSTTKKQTHVPYRDSVLTWLLKESLGGNAKTIMIAALSPADINYGETLSTLRYADNAKQIKNHAVVNEDPTARTIRELKEEVEALRSQMLLSGGEYLGPQDIVAIKAKDQLVDKLKEELDQREKLIAEMNKSWEEKLSEARAAQEERKAALADMGVAIKAVSSLPYLMNLNEDPLMSESLIYYLKDGTTKVGRSDADTAQDIQLNGLSIAKAHCTFENKNGVVMVAPVPTTPLPLVFLNGVQISASTKLSPGNRVVLGNNHFFRFMNPEEAAKAARDKEKEGQKVENGPILDWNYAIKELAMKQGQLILGNADLPVSREDLENKFLEEKVMQVSLFVNEANAISEALDNTLTFEMKLSSSFPKVGSQSLEKDNLALNSNGTAKSTDVCVQVGNKNGNFSVLEYDDFLETVSDMRDFYQEFIESGINPGDLEQILNLESEDSLIGVTHLYLKQLAYGIAIDRNIPILDQYGESIGDLAIEMVPFFEGDSDGNVKDPQKLLGKRLSLTVRVKEISNLSLEQFTNIHCRYSFFPKSKRGERPGEEYEEIIKTHQCTKESVIDHEKIIEFETVSTELVNYLSNDAIAFEIWGKSTSSSRSHASGTFDLFASVNVLEEEDNQYIPVPVKEDHHTSKNEKISKKEHGNLSKTSSVFLIRPNYSRNIVLNLLRAKDENGNPIGGIEKCYSATISNVRLKKSSQSSMPIVYDASNTPDSKADEYHSHSEPQTPQTPDSNWKTSSPSSASSTPLSSQTKQRKRKMARASIAVPPNYAIGLNNQMEEAMGSNSRNRTESFSASKSPLVPAESSLVSLSAHLRSDNVVVLTWTPFDHPSPLFVEKTLKGFLVTVSLQFRLKLVDIPKVINLSVPVHFKVVEPRQELKQSAALLRQYKGLLKEKTPGQEELYGSLFSARINSQTSRNDENPSNSSVTALIDEHRQNVAKLGNAIEQERLKQELELEEILKPSGDKKNDLVQQISHLKSEESNRQTARKKMTMSVITTQAHEVPAASLQRDVEISGFLKKKSSGNKWKRVWFVLSRPFLYYYNNENLENEKAIDLTNSAVTHMAEEDSPFCFAVLTWKRVWILQAPNQNELNKWMKALDPSLNNKERFELKEKLDVIVKDLESKNHEINSLKAEVNARDQSLSSNRQQNHRFMRTLFEQLEKLKEELEREKREKSEQEGVERASHINLEEKHVHLEMDLNSLRSKASNLESLNKKLEEELIEVKKNQTETEDRLHEDLALSMEVSDGIQLELDEIRETNAKLNTELASLRARSKALETQLKEAQHQRAEMALHHPQSPPSSTSSKDDVPPSSRLEDFPEFNRIQEELQEAHEEISIQTEENLALKDENERLISENLRVEKEGRAMASYAEELRKNQEIREEQLKMRDERIEQLESELMREINSKNDMYGLLEGNNDDLQSQLSLLASERDSIIAEREVLISKLNEVSRSAEQKLSTLEKRTKVLESEVIEKEFQIDSISSRLHMAEEDLREVQAQLDQAEDRIKLQKEELDAKSELLTSKFVIKSAEEDSGWSLFGGGKSDVLQRQLSQAKKASLAHQTHNSFLAMEITRKETEFGQQLTLKQQTIERLKKEIGILRKKLLNVSLNKGERMSDIPLEVETDPARELAILKKKYFINYALGVKMNFSNNGFQCNINANQLYEDALSDGITHYEEFADYIDEKFSENAVAMPRRDEEEQPPHNNNSSTPQRPNTPLSGPTSGGRSAKMNGSFDLSNPSTPLSSSKKKIDYFAK